MVNRENDRLPLAQRNHHPARLGAWTLLYHDELAAGEVGIGGIQQDGCLQRKHHVPIEILMQAVEAARPVAQQQWRRPGLAGGMALRQIGIQRVREGSFLSQGSPPLVRHLRESGIQRRAQGGDRIGQGIREVFVLSAAIGALFHDDTLPEAGLVFVQRNHCRARSGPQQRADGISVHGNVFGQAAEIRFDGLHALSYAASARLASRYVLRNPNASRALSNFTGYRGGENGRSR